LIAAIPHGYLPANPLHWVWIGLAGLLTGAITGALIGLVCGAPAAERLPELFRRVPVLADWARAVRSDPRLREASKSRPSMPRAPRAVSFSDGDTPLPKPVPLGDDADG
jgi:hypothetical protein